MGRRKESKVLLNHLNPKSEIRNPKHETKAKSQFLGSPNWHGWWFGISSFSHPDLFPPPQSLRRTSRISIFGFLICLRFHRLVFICGLLLTQAVLLMAQEAESGPGFRSHSLRVPATGRIGFSRLPGSLTGITFTNRLSDAAAAANQIRMNGSGVAAGDVDGDGWCDL